MRDGQAAQATLESEMQGAVVRGGTPDGPEIIDTVPAMRHSSSWADGRLGEILAHQRQLTSQQVERIAAVARLRRVRFGDAAVALGLASAQDVFQALASQFRYACAAKAPGRDRAEQMMLHRPRSAQAEAVRALRSELSRQVFRDGEPAASLAVLSPQAQDGKSFLSAKSMAVGDCRTLRAAGRYLGMNCAELVQRKRRHMHGQARQHNSAAAARQQAGPILCRGSGQRNTL
jgi:hypothetical protein